MNDLPKHGRRLGKMQLSADTARLADHAERPGGPHVVALRRCFFDLLHHMTRLASLYHSQDLARRLISRQGPA
jgi:hypothetical protein